MNAGGTAEMESAALERYPALHLVPFGQRAALAAHADAGLPLTDEHCRILRLHPDLKDLRLMPQGEYTTAQIEALMQRINRNALRAIAQLAYCVEDNTNG